LPENLLESELFGHRRGAFTGAINDKKGLFQEADGGTIFLDEVGTMSQVLQSRLLRVLQEREVRRVGDNTPVYVNVRVIAATNEPLEKRIREGTFREDLYYRLNVISIPLPPLRERKEDIPLLVGHFLRGKVAPDTRRPYQITRQAMDMLAAHNWPGNVRELENALERAATLCEGGVIRSTDLPPAVLRTLPVPDGNDVLPSAALEVPENALYPLHSGPVEATAQAGESPNPADGTGGMENLVSLKAFLRQQEQAYMEKVLERCKGDKEQAALVLGVSLATLYRKLSGEGND
jgi:transcriptional regulator with PAS, ATPase and Fis domain